MPVSEEGGRAAATAQVLRLVNATEQDSIAPSIKGGAITDAAGRLTFPMVNPTTVCPLPSQGWVLGVPTRDLNGNVTTMLGQRDALYALLAAFAAPTAAEVDRVIYVWSADGMPTAATKGAAMGFVVNGGNWQLVRSGCVGGGWSAWATAVATSASTRMAVLDYAPNTTGSAVLVGGYVLSALGALLAGGSYHLAGASFNYADLTPDFDWFGVGVGYMTGVGGSAGNQIIAGTLSAMDLDDIVGAIPL